MIENFATGSWILLPRVNILKLLKRANVSIRRKKQFALIQPSTKTRIDLGLKFKDKPIAGRLKESGSFGSICSHRIEINNTKDLDTEMVALLREGYENAV